MVGENNYMPHSEVVGSYENWMGKKWVLSFPVVKAKGGNNMGLSALNLQWKEAD